MTHHAPQGSTHGARIGHGQAVIGSTEAVMEFLGLSPQHNEHCIGYRWHLYMQDNDKRLEAMREAARKIIAARRAIEDADELARDHRKQERV